MTVYIFVALPSLCGKYCCRWLAVSCQQHPPGVLVQDPIRCNESTIFAPRELYHLGQMIYVLNYQQYLVTTNYLLTELRELLGTLSVDGLYVSL